jgi:hypothetical protein
MSGAVYSIEPLPGSRRHCARCEEPKPLAAFLLVRAFADSGGRSENRQPVCRACAQEISDHYGASMPHESGYPEIA